PGVPWIHWRGESQRTADDLTGPADEQRGALQEAIAFLRIELAEGPKPTAEVMKLARAAGHSERTITRARRELRVQPIKVAGGWVLTLPTAEDPKEAKAAKAAK